MYIEKIEDNHILSHLVVSFWHDRLINLWYITDKLFHDYILGITLFLNTNCVAILFTKLYLNLTNEEN